MRRVWIALLWLACVVLLLGLIGIFTDEDGPRPSYLLPLPCGTSWQASTYARGFDADDTWTHEHQLDLWNHAPVGTPVLASAAGRAWLTDKEYGEVYVDHGGDWGTVYVHLDDVTVTKKGREVKVGEQLGVIGAGRVGERSSGPHLHYAQLADGEYVAPVFTEGTFEWGPGQTLEQSGLTFEGRRASTTMLTSDNCPGPGGR